MGQRQSILQHQTVEVVNDHDEDFSRDLDRRRNNSEASRKRGRTESLDATTTTTTNIDRRCFWKRFKNYLGFRTDDQIQHHDWEDEEDQEEFEIIDPEKERQEAMKEADLETMGKNSSNNPEQKSEEDNLYLDFPFLVDEKTRKYISGSSKILFVLRGLSGSGKSTLTKQIVNAFPDITTVCSADEYFLDRDSGEYRYDRGQIQAAHEFSQTKAKEACCEHKRSVVVVDNTNVARWEMNFYFQLAKSNGYRVILLEPKTPWRLDPDALASRNKHGVSREILAKKVGQFKEVLPMYYAWFSGVEQSQTLLSLAKDLWLDRCLRECSEFKKDFERFSGMSTLADMLDYYNRDACLPSNRDSVHCTAKFCGKEGGRDYAKKEAVIRSLGRVFDLDVIGFVVTERTFGARVKLSEEELEVWGQEEEEEDVEVVQGSGKTSNKMAKAKKVGRKAERKAAKKAAAKTRRKGKRIVDDSEDDDVKNSDEEEEEKEEESSVAETLLLSGMKLEDSDTVPLSSVGDRFYPIPGVGRRAHITLGTAPGVQPVTTGLDLLDIVRAEKAAVAPGAEPVFQANLEGVVLRRYEKGLWALYPDKNWLIEGLFTGHY